MKDNLISVIVPIYNVENYLDRCITSIVEQTYQNLQIILVDDGSRDKSPEIADAWAEKDIRISVIHQENKGLSEARNAGLRVAEGDFIAFVDSDDYLHKQMYEIMLKTICNTDSDIVICQYKYSYDDNVFTDNEQNEYETAFYLEGNGYKAIMLHHKHPELGYAWNKLYKRKCIGDIRFPAGMMLEDMYFNSDIYSNANKMVVIKNELYAYRQRTDSIMGEMEGNLKFDSDYCRVVKHKLDVLKTHNNLEDYSICLSNELNKLARFAAKKNILKQKQSKRIYRKTFVELYKEMKIFTPKLSLFYHCPFLYYALIKKSILVNELHRKE